MAGDREFYCNMKDGFFGDWKGIQDTVSPQATVRYTREVSVPEDGVYFLQFQGIDHALQVRCNDSQIYIHGTTPMLHGEIREVKITLRKGENALSLEIINPTNETLNAGVSTRLLNEYGEIIRSAFAVPLPALREKTEIIGEASLQGFTPGPGAGFKSCGRFGYTMGHGILDCSMAGFGLVTKPYISGHPDYTKTLIWHFTLLPENEEPTCNLANNYELPSNETIRNDWSGVCWARTLKNGKQLSFDFSVLTPEILIETDMNFLNIGNLKGIGAYRKITLPQKNGAVVKTLFGEMFYDRKIDGELERAWVMFSDCGNFPEVPLQLIFQNPPERISTKKDPLGVVTDIRIEFAGEVGWAMLLFPFGIQVFKPVELTDAWHASAVEMCSRRHQYALARPVACEEYFKAAPDRVEVLQQFKFQYFTDFRETPAITASRFPPPLGIAQEYVPEIQLEPNACPLDFPTKYGPLYGIEGKTSAKYSLPVPETKRDIALNPGNVPAMSDMISRDFDEFMKYHLDAPEVGNPGNYSFVFQYSFVLMIFNILKDSEKERLRSAIRAGLRKVCDPDASYIGPGGRKCLSWYTRTEPFSGVRYYSTYLHVFGIMQYADCERETIENSKTPFVEVDWGNAMSLYGAWYGAMFTDSWDLIRKSWGVFRKAFDYYLVMMDWACMTTAYCEHGVSWSDGTNYGAYLGFLNMAEMTGNESDLALARYAYAKMFAMRVGLFYSSQKYFYKYFSQEPWWTTKFFHEETDASRAFLSYPKSMIYDHYRSPSFYNMTTEGHYKEAWNAYLKYMPEEVEELLSLAEISNPVPICGPRPEGVDNTYHTVGNVFGWQEVMTYLMFCIITRRYDSATLEKMIRSAADNRRISKEFLGHIVWSKRRVPAEWAHVYLVATLHGRDSEKLLAWKNLEITATDYPQMQVKYLRDDAWLEILFEKELRFTINGKPGKAEQIREGVYKIRIEQDSEILFG